MSVKKVKKSETELIEEAKQYCPPWKRKPFKLSGSRFKAVAICPSWIPEDEKPDVSTVAADKGTAFHEALETGDTSGLDEEQLYFAGLCKRYIEPLLIGAVYDYTEPKFESKEFLPSGKIDKVIISRTKTGYSAHVIDWKYGMWEVDDAEHNWQGFIYMSHVYLWEELRTKLGSSLEEITMHFVQPRIDSVSHHTFTSADLENILSKIKTIVEATQLPEETRPRIINMRNCQRCGDLYHCPKFKEKAISLAQFYSTEHPELPIVRPSALTEPEQYAMALEAKDVLEEWCKSVKHFATQYRLGGHEIPGYELTKREGVKSFDELNNERVMDLIKSKIELEDLDVLKIASIPYKKLLELLGDHGLTPNAIEIFVDELKDQNILKQNNPTFYLKRKK